MRTFEGPELSTDSTPSRLMLPRFFASSSSVSICDFELRKLFTDVFQLSFVRGGIAAGFPFLAASVVLIVGLNSALGQIQYSALMSFGLYGAQPKFLIEGKDGALYGTTSKGGTNFDGIIFKVNKDGSGFRLLHHMLTFVGGYTGGAAWIMEGSDGLLYGCVFGDVNFNRNPGNIFRLNKDGSAFTILSGNPGNPFNLVEGRDGALYGTAFQGKP